MTNKELWERVEKARKPKQSESFIKNSYLDESRIRPSGYAILCGEHEEIKAMILELNERVNQLEQKQQTYENTQAQVQDRR